MITGVGVDIVETHRIAGAIRRYGNAFLNRIYTESEQEYCLSRSNRRIAYQSFAARFAAKEAVFKALGISGKGMRWKDIEILNEASGKPFVNLHRELLEFSKELGIEIVMISLSHSREYGIAYAIAVG